MIQLSRLAFVVYLALAGLFGLLSGAIVFYAYLYAKVFREEG